MTLRSTLYEVLFLLRSRIGDLAEPQVFTDSELQALLDGHRVEVRYLPLDPVGDVAPGGTVSWLEYHTPVEYSGRVWEDGATLVDGAYNSLTPTSADPTNGIWTLSTSQDPPVLLNGRCFDLAAAAADALEQWAGRLKLAYDFSAENASFHRSQMVTQLLALAREQRRQALPRVAQVRV